MILASLAQESDHTHKRICMAITNLISVFIQLPKLLKKNTHMSAAVIVISRIIFILILFNNAPIPILCHVTK